LGVAEVQVQGYDYAQQPPVTAIGRMVVYETPDQRLFVLNDEGGRLYLGDSEADEVRAKIEPTPPGFVGFKPRLD